MTEHKFTDEEIIKALECCVSGYCIDGKCPLFDWDDGDDISKCTGVLATISLDLINRQNAEIKALKDTLCGKLSASAALAIKDMDRKGKEVVRKIKAEAVKEFAERLKKYYASLNGKTAAGCVEYHIDQILKEMIGETK